MINRYTQFPLLGHNTFGMDVQAAQFIEFDCEGDVMEIVREGIDAHHIVIGGGSNLLFLNDYSGTVLHSRIMDITVVEEDNDSLLLRVGSGVTWDDLVAYSVEKGWQGLENLSAIPGEVGASAVQNVGAYGVEAGDLIERVEAVSVIDASKRCFSKQQCRYSYRSSIFKQEEKGKNIITYVTFRLNKTNKFVLTYGNLKDVAMGMGELSAGNIRAAVMQIRASKLPDTKEFGSAGSFFMNPVIPMEQFVELQSRYPEIPSYPALDGYIKVPAGWLIEKSGWKGKSLGNAAVYEKQALVLINRGGATGMEVRHLADTVIADVQKIFGITLHAEVNYIE